MKSRLLILAAAMAIAVGLIIGCSDGGGHGFWLPPQPTQETPQLNLTGSWVWTWGDNDVEIAIDIPDYIRFGTFIVEMENMAEYERLLKVLSTDCFVENTDEYVIKTVYKAENLPPFVYNSHDECWWEVYGATLTNGGAPEFEHIVWIVELEGGDFFFVQMVEIRLSESLVNCHPKEHTFRAHATMIARIPEFNRLYGNVDVSFGELDVLLHYWWQECWIYKHKNKCHGDEDCFFETFDLDLDREFIFEPLCDDCVDTDSLMETPFQYLMIQ